MYISLKPIKVIRKEKSLNKILLKFTAYLEI